MAQTRKKRRRKHRGTQGGRIDTKQRSRPRSRAEAQSRARKKRGPRADHPPTWRSAILRGSLVSAMLVAVLIVFDRPLGPSILLGVFMLAVYIPMGYYIDLFMWRRRERSRLKDR